MNLIELSILWLYIIPTAFSIVGYFILNHMATRAGYVNSNPPLTNSAIISSMIPIINLIISYLLLKGIFLYTIEMFKDRRNDKARDRVRKNFFDSFDSVEGGYENGETFDLNNPK